MFLVVVFFGSFLLLYVPVNSFTFFLGKLEQAVNQYFVHILLHSIVGNMSGNRC